MQTTTIVCNRLYRQLAQTNELGDTLAELTAKIKTLKNILDFICPF
jgi:hypothetical protein